MSFLYALTTICYSMTLSYL